METRDPTALTVYSVHAPTRQFPNLDLDDVNHRERQEDASKNGSPRRQQQHHSSIKSQTPDFLEVRLWIDTEMNFECLGYQA
ncbi:hypothetical protein FH972_010643 [Carpinus fangiana]|uniref:Uncharacterized protein n=1 Tax=Carpinus fangiana TaxID=176857 RepID=A0A660KQS9_9ROSI|nr:hypothetical protein FH972_010643 [Carpinus fangiana]